MQKELSPHYVILNQDKIPTYPPRGGVDGNEVYPETHNWAGSPVAAGTKWQKFPAPKGAAKFASDSPVEMYAGIMPSSVGCVVVDVDTGHSMGVAALVDTVAGSLGEPAYTCDTPSGGKHLYYRVGKNLKNRPWDYLGEKGGDIKCHNGYVALYDWEGFHVFLENISDYVRVDFSEWPISENPMLAPEKDEMLQQNPGGRQRLTDAQILEWLTRNVDPDIEFWTWLKIGMGLHHEGYSVSIWDTWSSRGSKYVPGDCEKRWSTFGRSSNPVTMATVVKEVNENSISKIELDSENQFGSHLSSSTQDEKVGQEGEQEQSEDEEDEDPPKFFWGDRGGGGVDRAIREWCQEKNVPLEYSISQFVEPDIERIMKFGSHRLVNVNGVLYSEYKGLWRTVNPKDDRSRMSMSDILRYSRVAAKDTIAKHSPKLADALGSAILRSPMSNRVIMEVCNTILLYRDSDSIKRIYSLNPDNIPILPIRDGRAIDLGNAVDAFGRYIFLSEDEVRPMYVEDLGFNVSEPILPEDCPKEEKGNWDIMAEIYGKGGRFYEIIRRMSLYSIPGSAKRVDMMAAATDGGKSLLSVALEHALPGVFIKVSADGYLTGTGRGSKSQFTPINALLNEHWGVLIDEIHETKITPGKMNSWGDSKVAVHKKGIDPYMAPNNGTVMLMGDEMDLPGVDPSGQGFKSRFFWAKDLREDGSMTPAQYRAAISSGGSSCLLYHFIKYASMQLSGYSHEEAIYNSNQEGKDDLGVFASELTPDIVTAIADIYQISTMESRVSADEIIATLKEYSKTLPGGVDIPDSRHLHPKIVAAFDNKAKRKRYRNSKGKRVSGYSNLIKI